MYNVGRFKGEVYYDGSGIRIEFQDGWNESCPWLTLRVKRQDIRDLSYLLSNLERECQSNPRFDKE